MNKIILPLAFAATTLIATSCSDDAINDTTPQIPDNQKEMISFSLSNEASSTRAGFTGSDTHIAMRIQSDEKGGSGKKYTRTSATAKKDQANSTDSYSEVTFTDGEKRYWDDAHGRKSLLSVFAVAVPNGSSSIQNNNKSLIDLLDKGDASKNWGTDGTNTIVWQVTYGTDSGKEQKKDDSSVTTPTANIDQEDLVYANNIQANGKDGIYRWDYTATTPNYSPSPTGTSNQHKDGQMLFFQQGMTNPKSDNLTDAPGHFDRGHLKFNHALSRISVKLIAGKGFEKAQSGSFELSSDGVQFLNMNVKGTLSLETGKWTHETNGIIVTKPNIKIKKDADNTTVTEMYYETVAQMLPDYEFVDGVTDKGKNVMQFTIDNNTYFVTQDMFFDALAAVEGNKITYYGYSTTGGNKFTMMQGKNYNFVITIDKKEIESMTATLKEWDYVNGQLSMDNSHIEVTTLTGTAGQEDFKLFRLEQGLDKIYTDDTYTAAQYSGNYKDNGVATLEEIKKNESDSYSPKRYRAKDWYYKDNQTAYHLRALNALAANGANQNTNDDCENVENPSTDPKYSYFKMENGAQDSHDYHWGAPMLSNATLKYEDNSNSGYTSSIHKGFVAPTNGVDNPINITLLHMMSNINVVLKTTAVTSGDHVDLRTGDGTSVNGYQYATVKITKILPQAKVDMGTGYVTHEGTAKEETMTCPPEDASNSKHYFKQTTDQILKDDVTETAPFTYAVVPQSLKRTESGSDVYVGITITTPDNNTYYVVEDLSKIKPTSLNTSQPGLMHEADKYITQWYPNHTYTYTFILTKKGIEAITCTLADWVEVNGQDTKIDLEN